MNEKAKLIDMMLDAKRLVLHRFEDGQEKTKTTKTLLIAPTKNLTFTLPDNVFICTEGSPLVGERFDTVVLLLGVWPSKEYFHDILIRFEPNAAEGVTFKYFDRVLDLANYLKPTMLRKY